MINDTEKVEEIAEKLYKSLKENESYEGMNEDIDFIFSCALHKKQSIWYAAIDELYWLSTASFDIRYRM